MKSAAVLLVLAGLAHSATPESLLADAQKYLGRGDRSMTLAGQADGSLPRLRAIQRAKPQYKWALRKAMEGLGEMDPNVRAPLEQAKAKAARALLSILNEEAVYYHAHGKLDLARRRNAEALALAPDDVDANQVKDALVLGRPPAAAAARPSKAQPAQRAKATLGAYSVYNRYWVHYRSTRLWRQGDTRFMTRSPARTSPAVRGPFKSAPRAAGVRHVSTARIARR